MCKNKDCGIIRYCMICDKSLLHPLSCDEVCTCELNISRTNKFISLYGTLQICNKECFEFFIKCDGCNNNFCKICDYAIQCDKCGLKFCNDCKEYKFCNTCNETHCYSCEEMLHCRECGNANCTTCIETLVCGTCFRGECEKCNQTELAVRIYECGVCAEMKCTSCSEIQICEYCEKVSCTECIVFCNEKCNGVGTLCKQCIKYDIHYMERSCDNINCQRKTCNDCKYKCNICYDKLCIDCFGIDGTLSDNDICKSCLWYFLIKDTRNDLCKTFPVEIIEMIEKYIVI